MSIYTYIIKKQLRQFNKQTLIVETNITICDKIRTRFLEIKPFFYVILCTFNLNSTKLDLFCLQLFLIELT